TELPCGDAHPVVVGGRGVVQEERLLDELHRVRRSGADAHNVTHELRTLRRIVPEAGYALRENVYPERGGERREVFALEEAADVYRAGVVALLRDAPLDLFVFNEALRD